MKYLRCVAITAYLISIKAVEEDEVTIRRECIGYLLSLDNTDNYLQSSTRNASNRRILFVVKVVKSCIHAFVFCGLQN